MNNSIPLCEKIVRLPPVPTKGGGKLPPPFAAQQAGNSTCDISSRLGGGKESRDARDGSKVIDWKPATATMAVTIADNDLWFSHKVLATLFGVTVQNISIHISDLVACGLSSGGRLLLVKQKEGVRMISRQVKHFPFEIAHAIAIRSRRYEELNHLVALAQREALHKPIYKISPIKERNFAALLLGALKDVEEVLRQHRVEPYVVDFFLPASGIVVEYDEFHHQRLANRKHDLQRQKMIEKHLGATFIRVPEGFEIEGLNAVLRRLFVNARDA